VIHGDLKVVTILSQRSDSMTLFAIIVQELPPCSTGGGKLFQDLTNPIQNLLWLVKIYHPHLAQFRDNTNFTISDLQNNTKILNLMNN
jgi:hypothetical protein